TKKDSRINTVPGPRNVDAIPVDRQWDKDLDSPHGTGRGCDSEIEFNPNAEYPDEKWFKDMPPEIALAHELIHADLFGHGTYDPNVVDGVRNGERQVIGLGSYGNLPFTENKIRDEWNPKQTLRERP